MLATVLFCISSYGKENSIFITRKAIVFFRDCSKCIAIPIEIDRYSYIHLNKDIKPNRELRRFAPQLSIGFDFCPKITDYSYKYKTQQPVAHAQRAPQVVGF
ncbi:hypothetical protein PseudUWO310_17345 [Pseudanabaena sp. UWO310]|nr:hypothetical protein PseudUWO310_17345 [Pseudanabaena sp. UWO310]